MGSPSSATHKLRQLSNQTGTSGGAEYKAVAYYVDWYTKTRLV